MEGAEGECAIILEGAYFSECLLSKYWGHMSPMPLNAYDGSLAVYFAETLCLASARLEIGLILVGHLK